ncbi:keratin, type I cytoskeletal 10 [Musca domestica]|uniref:Keratin, type I cytoskeletal 10 n=1 Tax=Musca domestica TaxID=7370 RepID=A0ABM3V9G5_MUSDO|nr:keratin, type I cytoskeletal 10 [Musca domestica]
MGNKFQDIYLPASDSQVLCRCPKSSGKRHRRRRRHWQRVTSSTKLLLQLVKVLLLITLCSSLVPGGVAKRARKSSHGKRFVIHVPLKIRTHHHMHTVYTHLQGGGGEGGGKNSHGGGGGGDSSKGATKQTIYKIMGYSTHHTSAGPGGGGGGGGGRGRGFGHGYGHSFRQGHRGGGGPAEGYGEINYDDYPNTSCASGGGGGGIPEDSLAHGDMIFNHYSRQDDEDDYPDLEELIEEEDEHEGDEWLE